MTHDRVRTVPDAARTLDRGASAVIHQQLSDLLRAEVLRLGPGAQLATEHQLATTHRVSRSTVRRAVQSLVDEGLLIRRQGKGTFAAPQRIVHPLDQLRPFISIFTAAGVRPIGHLLSYGWASPSEVPRSMPAMSDGALRVRRLYLLADAPQALADIYVPGPFGKQIARLEIEEHPIYQVLQDKLGITLAHATVTLRSAQASGELAERLRLDPGAALLVMQRATYDDQERLVEGALYHLPADKFELQLSVPARRPEALSYSFTHPGANLVLLDREQAADPAMLEVEQRDA